MSLPFRPTDPPDRGRAADALSHVRRHGGRSAATCRYRCGDACSRDAPNTSGNEYFGDLASRVFSRRAALRTGVAGGAALALTGLAGSPSSAEPAMSPDRPAQPGAAPPGLRFTPVPPNRADAVTTAEGYRYEVLVRWGDVLGDGVAEFDPRAQTAEAQARQFGYNCDYLALLAGPRPRCRVLVANHEYTNEELMFPGYDPANPTREQVEVAWAAHGMSVLVVRDEPDGRLTPQTSDRLNRRVTATTPFAVSGPAAGSPLLRTSADPQGRRVLGTLNNCGGGTTPWGTVLSGEENFNQYFGNADRVTDARTREALDRYGFAEGPSERQWERFDPRFDLGAEPNEAHRHGWIVEIDPYDPGSTPRKLTALGRFKHEAAEPRVGRDGRVALYMGDDERFDYLYKYVSDGRVMAGSTTAARRNNAALLDEGTLYVARFSGNSPAPEIDGSGRLPADGAFDGDGTWIPLASKDRSFVDGMSAEEVYVLTRLAADRVGATKMDRPEDIEPHPRTGTVYVALTNNEDRGAAGEAGPDEPNPRNGNKHGQVLELVEAGDDPTAGRFGWRLLLVCGDPADPGTYFAGFPKDQVSPVSCPDNVAFDGYGNLWIATDGNALEANDGLFAVALDGPQRGRVSQFLTVPVGAETCGPVIERARVLVAVQHPGEGDGATVEAPVSTWPDGPGSVVRPSVIVVRHGDGRSIGT